MFSVEVNIFVKNYIEMQRPYHFKTQKHNFNKTTNQILTYPPDFSVKYSSSTTPTKAVTNNSIATNEKLIEH